MTLTASVVGGGMGGKLSLTALLDSPHCYLAAAADLNPEVCAELRERYPGLRTFASHQQMFAACPTDVVCVSTFPPSHEEVALAALDLPLKGILVEKPLGHTVASGRRILETVRQQGIPMAVPHNLLVRKAPLEIIARVQSGEIGELKLVEIQCHRWDIMNAGIHWLDFFVTLTGNEPMDHVMALCESSTRTYRDGMQVETTAVTYAQTASGVPATTCRSTVPVRISSSAWWARPASSNSGAGTLHTSWSTLSIQRASCSRRPSLRRPAISVTWTSWRAR